MILSDISHSHILASLSFIFPNIRRGADKSLARPTSRCHRTDLIVPLERGICSCAELQVFSCYREWKEACPATRAVIKFFFLLGKAPKEIYAILTETLGEHAPSCATVKNWMAQFKRGDFFHLWYASSWMAQNSDHPGDYWSYSRANLRRPPDFG